jgi:PfaD family protein
VLTLANPTRAVTPPAFSQDELADAVQRVREDHHVVRDATGRLGVSVGDVAHGFDVVAHLPPTYPEWLGDRSFCEAHGVRFPYVAGAMANGIATAELVIEMGRAGMLGFFGAAGLRAERVEAALDQIQGALTEGQAYGSNLIHSPSEPELEDGVVDLYLRRGVTRVSASAYMQLTPMIVRYAVKGLREVNGRVERTNHVFAKISRVEVARRFMSPAPAEMLNALVAAGKITADEARLAAKVPVAEDYTVEADSGGHTDNQSLTALFPNVLQLRDEMMRAHGYARPIRVGAAGGIGTPAAAAAAFALGASYVLTGSVNQSAIESGLSEEGRRMLADADVPDVTMAPAADMFELGVEVQVLKRGTMFAARGKKLHEVYARYDSLDALPADELAKVEKIFGMSADQVWAETKSFWDRRAPAESARAARDPKHKMALMFRWYLGKASRWANAGEPGRKLDFQIWCGPAMGSFNRWAKGSFLEPPEARTVVQIAKNLLEGATVVARAQQLRTYGVPVPASAFLYSPRPLA